MVEQQVEVEVFAADSQTDVASDEREADAEFDHEVAEMGGEVALQLVLAGVVSDREEVEVVRVFEDLLSEVGLGGRQNGLEVGDRLALPVKGS